MTLRSVVLILVALVLNGEVARAEWKPTRPITIVVPFSAGGVNDIVSRAIASRLSPLVGVPVVVENRTGASGTIAMTSVAKAEPDGYTLIMGCSACLTITPHLPGMLLAMDPLTAFAPVTFVARSPLILVSNPKLGVASIKDLVSLAREKPGALSYGSIGVGSITHLAAMLFESVAGIKMTNVPYRGTGGGAMTDVMTGNVDILFDAPETSGPQVSAGNLRLLATSGDKRLEAWPDVPTIAESGYPQYSVQLWFALLAPGGTPEPVVNGLNARLRQVLDDPEFQSLFKARGLQVGGSTAADLQDVMRRESARWKDVIQKAALSVK